MMTTKRRGRIHFRPSDNPYPLEMIQQALPTLHYLNLFGGLTSWQVAKLLFLNHPNSKGVPRGEGAARKAANHYCLRRLKDLGLVKVKPIPRLDSNLSQWEINHLTRKGYDLLKSHSQELPPYRSPQNLTYRTINAHAMASKDAAISAFIGAKTLGMDIDHYLDDAAVRSYAKQKVIQWPMEPDAVLVMRLGEVRRAFFIEVDMGTESIASTRSNSWQTKMTKYKHYSATRSQDSWLGTLPQPDIMIVAPSDRRLTNLLDATARTGGRSAYWFTTHDLLEPPYSFFGTVWQRIGLPGYYTPSERFSS